MKRLLIALLIIPAISHAQLVTKDVKWDAPVGGQAPTYYEIGWGVDPGDYTATIKTTDTATTATISIDTSTTKYYNVRACNEIGCSDWNGELVVGKPNPPSNLQLDPDS